MAMKKNNSESDLAKKYERYYYFSDNSIKDRLATQAAGEGNGTSRNPGPPPEKSGRAQQGWDKYYFFSMPFDNSICTATCRNGRSRPAAEGPQTFLQEAFTPDVIARERKKIEARGARTSYTEFFSQFPRAGRPRPDLLGPLPPRMAERPKTGPALGASASDPGMQTVGADGLSRPPRRDGRPHGPAKKEMTAVEHATNGEVLHRHGPYWPMKKGFTPEGKPLPPPNPVDNRRNLFGGAHRTFQDLHSQDRPAPHSAHYTCGPGM